MTDTDKEELREAFLAGFMCTGKGMNGEYVRSGRPEDIAELKFERWSCNHDWEVVDEERGRDELGWRKCGDCGREEFFNLDYGSAHPSAVVLRVGTAYEPAWRRQNTSQPPR